MTGARPYPWWHVSILNHANDQRCQLTKNSLNSTWDRFTNVVLKGGVTMMYFTQTSPRCCMLSNDPVYTLACRRKRMRVSHYTPRRILPTVMQSWHAPIASLCPSVSAVTAARSLLFVLGDDTAVWAPSCVGDFQWFHWPRLEDAPTVISTWVLQRINNYEPFIAHRYPIIFTRNCLTIIMRK